MVATRMTGATVALLSTLILSGALPASESVRTGGTRSKGPVAESARRALPRPVRDGDYYDHGRPDPLQVELGRLLFFDKILSGNRNISCATCHHALADTGDGLSLPVGEGGRGLGVTRDTGSGADAIHERVPRNAPPLFNLGAKQFRRMFHDGRVELDPGEPSGFRSPAGGDLPPGLANPLAVQAMFPVTSPAEMAGQGGENEIADTAEQGDFVGVWLLLADRLRAIDHYVELFTAAYESVETDSDITFVHAANAIAAFEAVAWRADNSPFDRYLRGDRRAMSAHARRGMKLFYGRAGCSECHSGNLQTDQEFHAIAMPQIGPGKGNGPSGLEDFGRENVTQLEIDRFRFRTPSLRNVALTGPWGHDGAFNSLRATIEHHRQPEVSLEGYDPSQAVLPSRADLDALDFRLLEDASAMTAIAEACELQPGRLSDWDVALLIEFLRALTDPDSVDLRMDVPPAVPSGLPLAE